MKKRLFLTSLIVLTILNLYSQNIIWTPTHKDQIAKREDARIHRPVSHGNYLKLNYSLLLANLKKAPRYSKNNPRPIDLVLELPMPDGKIEKYYIHERSIMANELAAKFPEIKTYSGVGIDDPTARIKITTGLDGFHAQILSAKRSSIYIDPYSFQDREYYISYHKKDLQPIIHNFECHFEQHNKTDHLEQKAIKVAGDCLFREYRIAVAATGEYTNFHGGTIANALSAINTSMARVNGIFEIELAITMTLIANNSTIIYTDGNTDPYSNYGTAGTLISENQNNLDLVIGNANYDIGHVFKLGSGGGGVLNSPCTANLKGRGVSGQSAPVNDPFDIDYLAHELGHQFGARHAFNISCSGISPPSYEPGSGNTIMAYAGVCTPSIQSNSDDFFHAANLDEIKAFVQGSGNSCPTITNTGNVNPVINDVLDKTIPAGTPFFIEATASDVNPGDILAYSFQQWDDEQGTPMPPEGTSTSGPLFKANKYTEVNRRYFPSIINVKNRTSSTWEVLPEVGRVMEFRATVRDLASVGGCTDEDYLTITASASGAPFEVTSQSNLEQWSIGSNQVVTWNVAGTNAAPINCSNVNILLSKDDGLTYPVTLASDIPNNGSATIIIPDEPTTLGRIMVVCSDNYFYNLNTARIGVGMPPLPEYCHPTYNNLSCSSNDYIDDVVFNTISNLDSGCALNGNYSNFSSHTSYIARNQTYTLTVEVTPNYPQYVIVGIDFNIDGDFDDTGEFFSIGTIASGATGSVNITIPNNATIGTASMRVMSEWNGSPPLTQASLCGNADWGEYEDYTILIRNSCESFTGKLFDDSNDNGCEDNSELGIAAQTVSIFECDAQGNKIIPAIGSDITNSLGVYKFGPVESGNANVCLDENKSYLIAFESLPNGYFFSRNLTCPGTPEASDVDQTNGESNCISANSPERNHVNAGILFCGNSKFLNTDYSGDQFYIEANILITANNKIQNDSNISYDSGMTICLENDFFVDQSSTFNALIEGCGNQLKNGQSTDSK